MSQDLQNPFKDLHYSKQLARPRQYLPLSLDEVLVLRQAAQAADDVLMATYIDIGRFTGMRLSEIGELSTVFLLSRVELNAFEYGPM